MKDFITCLKHKVVIFKPVILIDFINNDEMYEAKGTHTHTDTHAHAQQQRCVFPDFFSIFVSIFLELAFGVESGI